jgi:hypothetical protein
MTLKFRSEEAEDGLHSPESAAELAEMQRALGAAISAWGGIEGSLSLIFQRAVGRHRNVAGSAAFSAVLSYEAQLSMTNAAVQATFARDPELLAEWKALAKRIDKLRPRRNKLAHGQIVRETIMGKRLTKTRFLPFFHMHHHHGTDAFEQWTVEQVRALRDDFKLLARDMQRFAFKTIFGEEGALQLVPLRPSPEPDRPPDAAATP